MHPRRFKRTNVKEIYLGEGLYKGVNMRKIKKEKLSVSEQLQDELEPIFHQ